MKNTLVVAIGISSTLVLLVILQHNLAFKKSGTIVLPAGGTYLGPTSAISTPQPFYSGLIKGHKYPYSFTVPDSIQLVTFPNDPFDIYALSINNQPPQNNVLIGVDDLNRTAELKKYIKGSKRTYVENWWEQFNALKGVISIKEFTNNNGLKGYKAKYINGSDADVFFEVADNRYVIHLANGPLDKKIFDAIVDSVAWDKK